MNKLCRHFNLRYFYFNKEDVVNFNIITDKTWSNPVYISHSFDIILCDNEASEAIYRYKLYEF